MSSTGRIDFNQNARHAIQNLLHGSPPNGIAPEDCGPWRDVLQAMNEAYADDGTPGARRMYDMCTRAEPALVSLIAGGGTAGTSGTAGTKPRFPLLRIKDLAQLPPTSWLIDDEIPANSLTLLYGPRSGGKSFVAIDRTLRVALAFPDRDVVYVAPEGSENYRKRIAVWGQHHQQETPNNFYLVPKAVQMMDSAAVAEFAATLAPLRPVLIVLDTLARCMVGGDENSSRDMGIFIENCDELRRITGATIMPIHHTGKGKVGDARGSSALPGACDVMIELQVDDGHITLTCAKSKDDAGFAPQRLRREVLPVLDDQGQPTFDKRGKAITSCVVVPMAHVAQVPQRGADLTDQQRAVLEALALAVFLEPGAKTTELEESSGVPRRSLYRVISTLLRARMVSQDKRGAPYRITPAGRAAIGPEFVPSQDTAAESPSVTCANDVPSCATGTSDTGVPGCATVPVVPTSLEVAQAWHRHKPPDKTTDTGVRYPRSEALEDAIREKDEGGA